MTLKALKTARLILGLFYGLFVACELILAYMSWQAAGMNFSIWIYFVCALWLGWQWQRAENRYRTQRAELLTGNKS